MSVVTTEQIGKVSVIRINRPDKMNAISKGVAEGIQQAFNASARMIQAAGDLYDTLLGMVR